MNGRLVRSATTVLLAGALAITGDSVALAQFRPAGPVKIIIGTGPGSSPDVICRIVAERLSQQWGQTAVVMNQPGAGGANAIRAAGGAPGDGQTLYFALASNFVALPDTQAKLPYDLARDFAPIGFIGEQPLVLGASPALGVKSVSELMALAKQKPGTLNMAAGNAGSILHFAGEWFRTRAGIEMTLVHYPGTPQALTDLLGGRVPLIIDGVSGLASAIDAGSVKPLAVMSADRLPNEPEWPTMSETLPGFLASGWLALMASPHTPSAVTQQIARDLADVLKQPDVISRLRRLGTYTRPMTPDQLYSFIHSQQELWKPIVQQVALNK